MCLLLFLRLMIYLTIIRESFVLALQELANNKLRALLSLTGITIGILCIISVFAAVDSLEDNIQTSINELGDNVLFVEKWPWAFGSDYPWWKYMNRPEANTDDFRYLQRELTKADAVAIQIIQQNKTAAYKSRKVETATVAGVSYDFNRIFKLKIFAGRYYTLQESESGVAQCVLGYSVAEALFADPERAIGNEISVLNRKVRVLGVLEKEGESIVGGGMDNMVMVPYDFLARFVNERSRSVGQRINVRAKDGVPLAELRDEVIKVMRKSRKLSPREEDNFALNQMSILSQGVSQTFGLINIAGMFIGGFSILVGGFGIANIMFVSVKERTRLIGIKMSLGAKKIFILAEFLIESILLCLIGGVLGLFMVYGIFTLANQMIDFTLVLSLNNILLGIAISFAIGIFSGIFPATTAARMDPVEAMRN